MNFEWAKGVRRSLRAKLLLPLFFGGVVLSLLGAGLIYQVAATEIRSQLVDRGTLLGAAIDQSFALAAHEFEMRLAIEKLVKQEHGVSNITLATGDPTTIWASSFHPGSRPDVATQDMLAILNDTLETGEFGYQFQANGNLVLLYPIGVEAGQQAQNFSDVTELDSYYLPKDNFRGVLFMEFDWQIVGHEVRTILWGALAIFLSCFLLLILLVWLLLNRAVLGRVHEISTVIRRYDSGDHAARVGMASNDEIGQMASAFDEALDSVADSQELTHKIFRSSPALSTISRREDGAHYDVNKTWSNVLGYSHEEAMEKTALELGVWAETKQRDAFLVTLQEQGFVRNFEATFATKDGRKLDVLVSGESLKIGDEDRLLVVTTDITEQKMLEAAQRQAQKMEAVGQLTGGVAHDFNNLLAVILGNLELLEDSDLPDSAHVLLSRAKKASLRGADLTRNMLSFARKAPLAPEPVDLNAMARDVKNWIGRTLPSSVSIETSLLAGLWKVRADPSSLESAILNLILNARDAMDGRGQLTIETSNVRIDDAYLRTRKEDLEAGRYVMLAISDTGSGISEGELEKIFEPFHTTKEAGKGSGLGLSMVLGFMKQSGGTVRVYSELGQGTTFKLFFPASDNDPESGLPTFGPSLLGGSDGLSILLAEDETAVRETLVEIVERAGHHVTAADTGDAAYEIFAADPNFDMLLTDIVMPGKLLGTDLAKKIRETAPDFPIAFMSGYATEATVHGNGLRSDDVRLMKPVQRSELLAAISKTVKSKPRNNRNS